MMNGLRILMNCF